MITINLLEPSSSAAPREWVPREQRSALVGLSLLAVTMVIVGGWWYDLDRTREVLDARIATSEHELARLKDAATVVSDMTRRKTELAARLSLIEQLRASTRAPVELLETVSQSVPDGLWLVGLKETGSSAEIDGRARSITAVTDFAERLQDSGLFKRPVEIPTTATEVVDEVTIVRFSLEADMAPESAPATRPTPAAGSDGSAPSAIPMPRKAAPER